MRPTASVIINTFDRAPLLRRLLASLGHLQGDPFEVIVVDGPSTDATQALLDRYDGRIKRLRTPVRNLSTSRNVGIDAAAGEVVVFIDDDAYPARPDWLTRFVDCFANDPDGRLGCVGGSVLHRDTAWYEFRGGAASAYGFQRFLDGSSDEADTAPDGSPWFLRPPGGNAAYLRSALIELGGFDEHYVYYADETDLAARLWRAGYRCDLLPENPIRHYSAPSERRRDEYDRNWDVIARSDSYFGVKNGLGPLPVRVARTARFAPQKHFVAQIDGYRTSGQISRGHWARLRGRWLAGVASGLWFGAISRRRTAPLTAEPPPFVPFSLSPPLIGERRTVALLSEVIAGQPGCGGVGRYTFDLAVALHERGHRVHVVCRDDDVRRRYHGLGFEIHGVGDDDRARWVPATGLPLADRLTAYSLAALERLRELHGEGVEIDVVHVTNWNTEGIATIRAGLHPTVLMLVTPLGQVVATERWDMDDDLATVIEMDRWQISAADRVCAPSTGVIDSYATMGVDRHDLARVERTPLGIDPDPRQSTPTSHQPHVLLFVGRLERRKGAEVLLDVLPDLLHRFPDWECHLVGADAALIEGGTLRDRFERHHRDAPWRARVQFCGMVSELELAEHYRRCDLFVAPSLYESFGLIFHEAMQYAKAVVGCATGGVPEVVADGEEGLLVPPGDRAALATALARLMGDAAERARMGGRGYDRVRNRQNATTMASALERVYGDLLDRRGEERTRKRHAVWGEPMSPIADGWTRVALPDGRMALEGRPGEAMQFHVHHSGDIILTLRTGPLGATVLVEVGGQRSRVHTGGSDIETVEHCIRFAGAAPAVMTIRVVAAATARLDVRATILGVRAHPDGAATRVSPAALSGC